EAPENSIEIDADGFVIEFIGVLEQWRGEADAGVVVHDVQSAEFVDRASHQPLDLLRIADIGRDECPADRLGDFFAVAVRQIADDDLCALLREQLHGRLTDTRCAARHYCHAICDSSLCHCSSSVKRSEIHDRPYRTEVRQTPAVAG